MRDTRSATRHRFSKVIWTRHGRYQRPAKRGVTSAPWKPHTASVTSTDATGENSWRKISKKVCDWPAPTAPTRESSRKAASDEGEIMNTTTYIRYSEPTVRNNVSQAYSQCMPEPDYGYSQQPMPVQAP